jgi:hypothetical protein
VLYHGLTLVAIPTVRVSDLAGFEGEVAAEGYTPFSARAVVGGGVLAQEADVHFGAEIF